MAKVMLFYLSKCHLVLDLQVKKCGYNERRIEMEYIKFHVKNQAIEVEKDTYFVSKTQGEYKCKFDFDESWEGLTKSAVFIRGNSKVKILLDTNNECKFADELITEKGNMYVGVYGANASIIKPTIKTKLLVVLEGVVGGSEPTPPTPSEYQQMIALYNQAITKVEEAKTVANQAKTESSAAKTESAQAVSTANTAKSTADTAKSTADNAKSTADSINAKAESALTKSNKALSDIATEEARAKARENEIEAKIPSHDNFATKTELQAEETRAKAKEVEIEGKIPTKTSQLTNDSGFVDNTYHDSTKVDKEEGKGLFSGSYNDLTDKPTIPEAQIQSDWNQTDSTKPDYIKNKPDELGLVDDVKVNGTSVVDASGVANVTVPTKTSDITNDSGFIDNTYHDATKQDVISDLETIRDGASKGATAIQEHQSLAAYRTAQEQDAIHDSTKQDVLTQADKQAIADLKDISGKVDKVEGKGLSTNDYTDADKTKVANAITEHQDISGKQDKTDNSLTTTSKTIVGGINELKQEIAQKQDEITSDNKLSYNLLKDTPTIPDVSGKQDKLIAGLNITIDADGKTINAVGGSTDIGLSIQDGQLCITYVKENN